MDVNFFWLDRTLKQLWRGHFSSSDKVLDVGCGEKPRYHDYLPCKPVCSDIAQTSTAHVLSHAQALPMKSSSFDGVVSVNALYYCEDPQRAVFEFGRVLRKNGKLIVVTPFMYPIHDAPFDRYRFTEFGLKEVLGKSFMVEKVVAVGGVFSLPSLLLHSIHKGLLRITPLALRPMINTMLFIVLLVPALCGLLISTLNILDRTRRWPVYYFTVARKK